MRLFNESRSRADAMLLDDAEKSLACLAGYGRGAPSLPRCSGVDLAGVRVPTPPRGQPLSPVEPSLRATKCCLWRSSTLGP